MKSLNDLGLTGLNPEGEAALKKLEELHGLVIEVGFQADQKADDGKTSLAEIAYHNHFGTVDKNGQVLIPARPFMDALSENTDQLYQFTGQALEALSTSREVAEAVGSKAQSIIQDAIRNGDWEPNAPSTVKKKGSDKPLIDTGKMRQGVSIRFDKKGGGAKG